MSADFWAGYISGAVGILIGNPLDLIKVRLQASSRVGPPTAEVAAAATATTTATASSSPRRIANPFTSASSLIRGATAPILGYGALNALLFMTYNRSLSLLSNTPISSPPPPDARLPITFLAGAIGGLATFVVSTPTELIKCRAQVSAVPVTSYSIARTIIKTEGLRGMYCGGVVTALRDSIGYGFYFWSYELGTRWLRDVKIDGVGSSGMEAFKVLLCGGVAGVVTWASVFPLDVIKTRVQVQISPAVATLSALSSVNAPLLGAPELQIKERIGAWQMAKKTYLAEGAGVFIRGLGVCSVRAFFVNAVQWAVYEWVISELDSGRRKPTVPLDDFGKDLII